MAVAAAVQMVGVKGRRVGVVSVSVAATRIAEVTVGAIDGGETVKVAVSLALALREALRRVVVVRVVRVAARVGVVVVVDVVRLLSQTHSSGEREH